MNKNNIKGAKDIGKLAEHGLKKVGMEIIARADGFEDIAAIARSELSDTLNIIDEQESIFQQHEIGLSPVDLTIVEDMKTEDKVIFINALRFLCQADETKSTSFYLRSAVTRFGVTQIIEDRKIIEKRIARFNNNETALLTRMIYQMASVSNGSQNVLTAGEELIENLHISEKSKREIKAEVDRLTNDFGTEIFSDLLDKDCPPIDTALEQQEGSPEEAPDDGYEACERFENFTDKKVKFTGTVIILTDRYIVSNSSLRFEDCMIAFDSDFPRIVEVKDSELVFTNCKFESRQERNGKAFISTGTNVTLVGCTFEKWNTGLFLESEGGSLQMEGCSILSCESELIAAENLSEFAFNNCKITRQKGSAVSLRLEGNKPVEINGCHFRDCHYSSGCILRSDTRIVLNNAVIQSCGMNIASGKEIAYSHCDFLNCHDNIPPMPFAAVTFTHCNIKDHNGTIEGGSLPAQINFSFCDITNFEGNIGLAFMPLAQINIKSSKFENFTGSFFARFASISNSTFVDCAGDPSWKGISIGHHLDLSDVTGVNAFDGITPTGSLIEIKVNKKSSNHTSAINNCKFIGCVCDGALVAVLSEVSGKDKAAVSECEVRNCKCAEGFFVGIRFKEKKLFLSPRKINVADNAVDFYDGEHREKLLKCLKTVLTVGLVKDYKKIHRTPVASKIEKNAIKSVMTDSNDEVIAIYDTSLLEDGSAGVAFGRKAVYFTQLAERNYHIPYEKIALIKNTDIVHKKYGNNYSASLSAELGNGKIVEFTNSNIEKKEFMKVLLGIRDAFQPDSPTP